MVDFTRLAATAKRLVDANGRSITLNKLEADVPDAAKPWRGAAAPAATPEATITLSGVAVSPVGAVNLGIAAAEDDFIKRATEIFIAAPGSTPIADLKQFQQLVDGSDTFAINEVRELRPADLTLLYYISVRK